MDLATASIDHSVNVEPFIADQIAIIKGPSTLLYGSAAIGGVVDVDAVVGTPVVGLGVAITVGIEVDAVFRTLCPNFIKFNICY